jgi:hypothetical protein
MQPFNAQYDYAEIERYLAKGRALHAQNMIDVVSQLIKSLTTRRPTAQAGFGAQANPV